ncbi:YndJ family transporter [Jiangella endophytica]|uniref:YndJ family transporter n=1 Tax=Jiangella endophytica TaxID=1623398 RepID=UPI000E34068A|nr:YndJ family transporter [Jiangella endophytica]
MTVLVGWILALGMVVVVPFGLRLIDDDRQRLGPVGQVWPAAGLLGGLSLLLDRGTAFAVALACCYAAVAAWLAVLALLRLLRRRSLAPVEIAVLTAMAAPAVAASSLIAERGGWELFGFGMTTQLLTVAHFHYAGFAAALVAALTASRAPSPSSSIAAVTVPVGIALVFLGYFTGDEVELAGAVVLTAGMWLLGWTVWRDVAPSARGRVTRALFGVSAAVLAVTMLLALSWAAGHVWDAVPHLSLTWMAATHGLANALGFALCGLLAWRRLQRAPSPEVRERPSRRTWRS